MVTMATMTMSKVMVITGGSRGIGAEIARLAAQSGYQVAISYLSNAQAAEDVVQAIRAAGGNAIAVCADVGDEHAVSAMFAAVDRELGKLDVLVNNAGMLGSRRIEAMDAPTVTEMFRANVFGTLYCAREAVRRMSTQHGGRGGAIINMSSVAARLGGLAGGTHYAASKGAIDSFTLALAKEVGTGGIRVNALRPGLIRTEIHAVHGGIDPVLAQAVPLGRSGGPEEVAEAALWLASDAASYVHGAVIDVSGGR